MKKILGIFLALIFGVGLGSAHAVPWTMDLSALNIEASVDGGAWSSTVSFTELMNITNAGLTPTNVKQSLGIGGVLGNNDTFTEWGFIKELGVDGNTVVFRDITSENTRRVYFEFDDVTGYIHNYDAHAGGNTTLTSYDWVIGDDTFDLVFDAGSGSINLYADANVPVTPSSGS